MTPLCRVMGTVGGAVPVDVGEAQGNRILISCNDVDRRLESDLIIGS
jgi:hypothetical protein